MIPTNNARVLTLNGYQMVTAVELVDAEQGIFKGEIVKQPEQKNSVGSTLFFRRDSGVDTEFDSMWPYIDFKTTELIGFPFVLVPKEKILFIYDEPSVIIKPMIDTNPRRKQ